MCQLELLILIFFLYVLHDLNAHIEGLTHPYVEHKDTDTKVHQIMRIKRIEVFGCVILTQITQRRSLCRYSPLGQVVCALWIKETQAVSHRTFWTSQ